MSEIAIHAEGLGKRYRIGERQPYLALRDHLGHLLGAPFRRRNHEAPSKEGTPEFLWALRDVSFDVGHGEVLGIVGSNGAGKSTLLKILARVTKPTEGWAEIRGRMGTLLEVGTGFHPELTGRENVQLSGAILGMRRREILRKFDEIVEFAEVEKFIDTPLKHYSSGMQMRLAFAVAAHLEPEILLVDEVLAVGDAAFQKKCLGKMGSVARAGRTVIFVSHNMRAVTELCRRVLWIDGGRIVEEGIPKRVVLSYLSSRQAARLDGVITDEMHLNPSGNVYFRRVRMLDRDGRTDNTIFFGEPLRLQVDFEVLRPAGEFRIGVAIEELDGTTVTVFNHTDEGAALIPAEPGTYSAILESDLRLMPGGYTIHLAAKPAPGFFGDKSPSWDWVERALDFNVEEFTSAAIAVLPTGAVVRPPARWVIQRAERSIKISAHSS